MESRKKCEELEQDTDFTIKVQGKEIFAHRSILSKNSEYYKAMLLHDTLERQKGVVEMKDVEFETVKACVDSMYGVEIEISSGNYQEILHVASIMQLTGVLEKIGKFLQSLVDSKSIFEVRSVAKSYFLKDLIDFCGSFVLENLEAVAKDSEFNQFEVEFVASLLVSKKSVHPKREDSKLAIILNWVRADRENRKSHLEVLLNLVKLSKVSKSYLKYVLLNEELIGESEKCMNMLTSAGLEPIQLKNDNNVSEKQAEICFDTKANAIVITNSYSQSDSLEAYHPEKKSCSSFCPKPPNCREVHDIVASEDFVYLYVVFEHSKVFRMDMRDENPQWMQMKNMISGHGWALRAALYNDFIYVVGSYCAERYSIANDEWSRVAGHRLYLNGCAVVVCAGFLYTIGEYGSHGEGRKEVQRLCTKTMNWSVVEPMDVARFSPKAVVYRRNIYVAGGAHQIPIECYNHDTGSWTKLTTPNEIRRGYAIGFCIYEKQLFCMNYDFIMSYDLERKRWVKQTRSDSVGYDCMSLPIFAPFQADDIDEKNTGGEKDSKSPKKKFKRRRN